MNAQSSKLSPCPTFLLLAFAVFLCVSVGGEYDCLFPSDPLWVFCNTSEGFKKQISGFIQCLSVLDSSRHRLCILKGMLIKLPSHSDEDGSFK